MAGNTLIIPTCGNATRLGIDYPKLLYKVGGKTGLEWAQENSECLFDKIIVVCKPEHVHMFYGKGVSIVPYSNTDGSHGACRAGLQKALPGEILFQWADLILTREDYQKMLGGMERRTVGFANTLVRYSLLANGKIMQHEPRFGKGFCGVYRFATLDDALHDMRQPYEDLADVFMSRTFRYNMIEPIDFGTKELAEQAEAYLCKH